MKDRIIILAIMWFFPWGAAGFGLWMYGFPGWGTLLGISTAVGIAFVLAMAHAAKDN